MSADLALGGGVYQQTKKGGALVWNNFPKRGDTATWSGFKDRDGYATGFGTLSWYTLEETLSGEPSLYARYYGRMVRGKFEGPVNVHLNDRTTGHALFIDGRRSTRWALGRAPNWRVPVQRNEPRKSSRIARTRAEEPEAPAEAPLAAVTTSLPRSSVPAAVPSGLFANDVDQSLQILAWPPSSLRMRATNDRTPAALNRQPQQRSIVNARLDRKEVVRLADERARRDGYNPADYAPPEPRYDPVDEIWSLTYDSKGGEQTIGPPAHFAVAIDDKTRKAVIARSH